MGIAGYNRGSRIIAREADAHPPGTRPRYYTRPRRGGSFDSWDVIDRATGAVVDSADTREDARRVVRELVESEGVGCGCVRRVA